MARVLTYHPTLKQLIYAPAAEYSQLHAPTPLTTFSRTPLAPYAPRSLGAWAKGAGNASEIQISFARPAAPITAPITLGLTVMSGALTIFINLLPVTPGRDAGGSASVTASADGGRQVLGGQVAGGQVAGNAPWSVAQVGIRDGPPPAKPPPIGTIGNGTCGATNYGGDCNVSPRGAWKASVEKVHDLPGCVAKARPCAMASYVSFSAENDDCSWYNSCDFAHLCTDCSKCGIGCPKYVPYASEVLRTDTTAPAGAHGAVKKRGGGKGAHGAQRSPRLADPSVGVEGSKVDALRLLPTDKEVTLQVFTDRTLVEAYFMGGRVAMTSHINAAFAQPDERPQAEVFATAAAEVRSVMAWEMRSIWASTEEVLATPPRVVR